MPESGFSWPVIILNRVDLPAPFGPMMPTMPPAGSLKERFSISIRSPKLLVRFSTSMTLLPSRSPVGMTILPSAGLRFSAASTSSL